MSGSWVRQFWVKGKYPGAVAVLCCWSACFLNKHGGLCLFTVLFPADNCLPGYLIITGSRCTENTLVQPCVANGISNTGASPCLSNTPTITHSNTLSSSFLNIFFVAFTSITALKQRVCEGRTQDSSALCQPRCQCRWRLFQSGCFLLTVVFTGKCFCTCWRLLDQQCVFTGPVCRTLLQSRGFFWLIIYFFTRQTWTVPLFCKYN